MRFNSPIDLGKSELRNAVIQNLASAPSTPLEGQFYYDTASHALFVWNGSGWVSAASAPNATGAAAGIVQLTNDLGGTYNSPTVVSLHLSADTAIGHKLTSVTDPTVAQDAATKNYVDTRTLSNFGAPTADLSIGTHRLTNVTDPSGVQDAATKNYVDSVAQGLSPKPSARVETTGAETYTIAAGSVTTIAGTTVNGVAVAVGDRILIKDSPAASGAGSANSTQPGNGLYAVTAVAANITVARDPSMSGNNGPAGAFVFVENDSAGYVVSTPNSNVAFVYGTNNIAWTQFSGAGEITAGTGLAKSGNTLSIENGGVLLATHGGSGVASPTAHGVLIGEGSGAYASITGATTGQALLAAGAAADPAFGALNLAGTSTVTGSLPVGNGGTNANSAAGARTNLGIPAVATTTLTGNGATTTYSWTPTPAPATTGAWNVMLINQSNGNVEFADITINQTTNQITVTFGTAPANGTNYTLIAVG